MLEAFSTPKLLPRVIGKRAKVLTAKEQMYVGEVMDINTVYVMIDTGQDDIVILPWAQITLVRITKEDLDKQ